MEDFDIQISMNGVENELNSNFVDVSRIQGIGESKLKDIRYLGFEGEPTDNVPEQEKKSWIDTLNNLTNTFKEVTGYQTNEQVKAKREKELAEKGTKYKVLGMNPFIAITVSLVVIIVGSIALTKIKA